MFLFLILFFEIKPKKHFLANLTETLPVAGDNQNTQEGSGQQVSLDCTKRKNIDQKYFELSNWAYLPFKIPGVQPKIPIMAHPPAFLSDLSLEEFLTKTIEVGVGFKTKKSFNLSTKILILGNSRRGQEGHQAGLQINCCGE